MKNLMISLLSIVTALAAHGQNVGFPHHGAVTTPGAGAVSPGYQGLPGSQGVPATPQFPGFGRVPQTWDGMAPGGTGFAGGLPDQTQLSALLVQVQRTIEQALPMLAAVNDSVAGMVGQPVSQDLGRFSGMPGRFDGSRQLAVDANRTGALSPAGVTNTFSGGGFAGFIDPSVLQGNADALRALLILQNDLERALPILMAVNGMTSTGSAVPGLQGTNEIQTPGRPPALIPGVPVITPDGQPLTPTGR
jgi:hypothetical protein